MRGNIYLSEIYIYPIKSLPGIRLNKAKCLSKGLKFDRRWMLVDSKGKFISLRNERKLINFTIDQTGLGFDIGSSEMKSTIQLPHTLADGDERKVKIWDDEVISLQGNLGWDDWFSEALGRAVSLVYFPEENDRKIKEKWQVEGESVSLADGYPYLIIGQNSLDNLNQKLKKPIGVERFRPNFVFKGDESYSEFLWKEFSIGDVDFMGLKPCERCIVTTIDTITGIAEKEPLKTLSKEKIDEKIVFGQHVLARETGEVKIGDDIVIKTKKESPYDEN